MIDSNTRTELAKVARGWRPYGMLCAEAVARQYLGRSIVELVTGCTRRDIYLGEFDNDAQARAYALECNRFMLKKFS